MAQMKQLHEVVSTLLADNDGSGWVQYQKKRGLLAKGLQMQRETNWLSSMGRLKKTGNGLSFQRACIWDYT